MAGRSSSLAAKLRAGVPILVVFQLAGCSFGVQAPRGGKHPSRASAESCTSAYTLPAFDALSAGFGAYGTAVSLAADDEVSLAGVEIDKEAGLAISLVQLGLFGASAVYGFVQVSRCNAARKLHALDPPAARKPGGGFSGAAAAGVEAANPGRDAPAAGDLNDALPGWSAFRRHPVEELRDEKKPSSPVGRGGR
jgi:hypothetical protein